MDNKTHEDRARESVIPSPPQEPGDDTSRGQPVVIESPAERRARRWFIVGAVIAGLMLIGLAVLMVFLSIEAYHAARTGDPPSAGSVVVALLRDTAIVFVAFESLMIGLLLIILVLQIQSLIVLLRDEVQPVLEAANETMSTVRGTTQFVSHSVVSPVVKWSSTLAGIRRIIGEITGLRKEDS